MKKAYLLIIAIPLFGFSCTGHYREIIFNVSPCIQMELFESVNDVRVGEKIYSHVSNVSCGNAKIFASGNAQDASIAFSILDKTGCKVAAFSMMQMKGLRSSSPDTSQITESDVYQLLNKITASQKIKIVQSEVVEIEGSKEKYNELCNSFNIP